MSLWFLFIVVQNIANNGHWEWPWAFMRKQLVKTWYIWLIDSIIKTCTCGQLSQKTNKKIGTESSLLLNLFVRCHTQTADTGWSTDGSLENWGFFFGYIELRFIMILVKFLPNNNSEIFHNFIVELSWWIPVP